MRALSSALRGKRVAHRELYLPGAGCGVWRAPDGETSGSMGPVPLSATAARAPLRLLLTRLSSLQSPHRTHSLPHAPFLP